MYFNKTYVGYVTVLFTKKIPVLFKAKPALVHPSSHSLLFDYNLLLHQ